jgi:hypothetical protein
MALNINNIVSRRKSNKDIATTPESFMEGLPAFTVNPKKEKGINGITFNQEAMDLLGLYQLTKDNEVIDRVILVPYTFSDDSEELVIDATHMPVIKAGKNFKAFTVNQNTRVASSNGIYNELVKHYKLDSRVASTFILEGKEGTFIMTPYQPAGNHFDEGNDIVLTTNEVKTGSDSDIDANVGVEYDWSNHVEIDGQVSL